VKAGDIVKVKVMEVDLARQRIALSMRLDDVPGEARGSARPPRDERNDRAGGNRSAPPKKPATSAPAGNNALADAFARALKR
jgi:uncharacterized protein